MTWPFRRPQPVSYKEHCDRYAAKILLLNEENDALSRENDALVAKVDTLTAERDWWRCVALATKDDSIPTGMVHHDPGIWQEPPAYAPDETDQVIYSPRSGRSLRVPLHLTSRVPAEVTQRHADHPSFSYRMF